MGRAFLILLASLGLGLAGPASAQEAAIGLAAPLTGSFALLGRQMEDGARAAMKMAGDGDPVVQDTACTPQGGKAAAEALVARKVAVVVGFLCTEALETAMPVFKAAGIPVVTPAVRTASVTDRHEKTGWPVFRTAPRDDAEEKAVADILVERWRKTLFAVIDDGTIYGRDLAENFRAAAELAGLKPVYVDTYRPQLDNQIGLVGRLRRAGATHVFVGGDRGDIAIMARDAVKLDHSMIFAGGESLRSEADTVPLAEGVLMVGLPRWSDIADKAALKALADAQVEPEGYVLPAFAAAQLAMQAVTARGEGGSVAEALAKGRFETALGAMRFDADGDLDRSLYQLFRYDGADFVDAR